MDELTSLSVAEMAQGVRSRRISPVELTQAHLARIERLDAKLHAFVKVDYDGALRRAGIAEAAALSRDEELGPLHGVPVTIKSSMDVAGFPCETGSRLRGGLVPAQDAPLVARLRSAGAVILGNTNVPEFLMAYETDNLLYGRTNNPWDLERTPGGSSGGEAAAIAARCSAAGIGSDGGGSLRTPAHHSGICALKPTPGRIPSTGHFPASLGPFALIGVVGPMARSARDLQIVFDVIAGADIGDTLAAPVPVFHPSDEDVRRLRIGYFESDGRTPVTPETAVAVRTAAAALQQQGFVVEPFRPDGLEQARTLWKVLFCGLGSKLLREMTAGRESDLSPVFRNFLSIAAEDPPVTLDLLLDTLMQRDELRPRFLAQMETFPILLCPACAIPAFRHGEREWVVTGQRVRYLDAMSYSQWFNLLGNPAAVVPMNMSPDGLPIGVQIVGRSYADEQVLAVAKKLEEARGPFPASPMHAKIQTAEVN